MAGAQLGPKYDLAVRLGRIEQTLAAMRSTPLGQALSSFQSDGSLGWAVYLDEATGVTEQITYYGPGTPGVSPTNGQWPAFLYIGQIQSGGTPAGTGITAARPDGSVSMTVGNAGVGLVDKHNNIIWSESETTFGGIKTPQLNISRLANTNYTTWPSTTATTWTTIASGVQVINQPMLAWNLNGYAPSGVTGQFRLTLNGATMASWSATGGFVGNASSANVPASLSWGQPYQITLDAYISAGTGTVYAIDYGIWGTATS